MPSLRELQSAFVAELTVANSTAVAEHVSASEFTTGELLQVYRNNHVISLTEALRAAYPVITKLVGDGFFAFMAHRYLQAHPSRSGNLHEFGAHLSTFVATFQPASSLPYLADVARLEWARQTAYHAADSQPLDLRALRRVPPQHYEQLRFGLHPSVGLISSGFPVLGIWEANQEDTPDGGRLDLDAGGDRVLILRVGADIIMQRLQAAEHLLLSRFAAGATLGEAVQAALTVEPGFDLENALQRHVLLGTVNALELSA